MADEILRLDPRPRGGCISVPPPPPSYTHTHTPTHQGHDIITDVEIDAILADRRGNGTFPVLQSSLKKFSDHVDLIKVRLHKSDKYRHVPIRIPKTEKNRGELL